MRHHEQKTIITLNNNKKSNNITIVSILDSVEFSLYIIAILYDVGFRKAIDFRLGGY